MSEPKVLLLGQVREVSQACNRVGGADAGGTGGGSRLSQR